MAAKNGSSKDPFLQMFESLQDDFATFKTAATEKGKSDEEIRMDWLTARLALIEQRLQSSDPPGDHGPTILKLFPRG